MNRSNPHNKVRQLYTGIHLVMIDDLWLTKNSAGEIISYPDGQTPLTVRFTDGKGYSFDNNYLLKGDKEFIFHKMCAAFGVDYSVTKLKDECGIDITKPDGTVVKATKPRRRGYIFIREVRDIDGTEVVKDEITRDEVVNYYIFDYAPFMAGQKAPNKKGCPVDGKGADGDFIDYRQIKKNMTKEERLAIGREIIAKKPDDVFTLAEEYVEPTVTFSTPSVDKITITYSDDLVLEEDLPCRTENIPAFDVKAKVAEVKNALFPNEEFFNQPESPLFGLEKIINLQEKVNDLEADKPEQFIEEELF